MSLPELPPPRRPPRRVWPTEPLPSYRYVPDGPHPHPVSDPQGHFFGRPWRAAPSCSHLAWMVDPLWLFGVDLYHHRYLWEAHEVWEPLWRAHDKALPPGMFLQGLMQCAAALLKVHEGNLAGVGALWGKAEVRLGQCAKAERELWGLRTDKTFRAFRRYFAVPLEAQRLPALDEMPTLDLRW